ncbi:MAG: hypothetical protein NUV73_00410 [Candidatus Daviesbacteria bacterium]|nr:hypothetical protein [Candidatus Daviesbacteria bacterium]
MKTISIWIFILVTVIFLVSPKTLSAAEETINCSNRYVTLVNPVRGRDLWIERSVKPLKNQYEAAKKYNFPVTWLLQYDVLEDKEVLEEIRGFDLSNELGVFLEVSPRFAEKARVIYPHSVPWFSPKAVFLSAYSQSERRKLIDKLFKEFKLRFGYYPKSVGAWWIDSYSLQFMKDKYDIKSVLIVSDQKTTDSYGVWGQWWGVPYYPSKANVLAPASTLSNKLEVVVTQWAQRDPFQAFGEGPKYSNYSLQANDYTEEGEDTGYFDQLVDVYLNCNNHIGQVTVGLETGIESIGSRDEYANQLESLKRKEGVKFVTMKDFAQRFTSVYPNLPGGTEIKFDDSVWVMTTTDRVNEKLNDLIKYQQWISFSDYFIADKTDFLNRKLPVGNNLKESHDFRSFLWVGLGLGLFSLARKRFKLWVFSMAFGLAAFGLILRSTYQYGWKLYFGPVIPELEVIQVSLILISFLIFLIISRKYRNIYLLPLVFGLDPLIQSLRFSVISNKYYFGMVVDALRFIGLRVSSSGIEFLNLDLPSYQAAALLRFNFDKVWDSLYLALIVYPLAHLFLGMGLIYILSKLPFKVRFLITVILAGLFILHIYNLFNTDPRRVLPILLQ